MNIIWKKTFKALLIILILLLISISLINILYYFDVIDNNIIRYFKMLLSIITFFIGGLYMGKNSPSKGYINGLRLSVIIILIMLVMGIIFKNIDIPRIIYYLIIIFCITFGSMLGINKKTN